ncbi:MAG: DUF2859 domain-containing protein [Gammaproteobacteria bacterium]|nr:DUF2859 domain-containing protein [Gammaproteobacteria bacterium]
MTARCLRCWFIWFGLGSSAGALGAPVVLGGDETARDISAYIGRIQVRLDEAARNHPPRPSAPAGDASSALATLENASFPVEPGAMVFRGDRRTWPIETHRVQPSALQDLCVIGTDDYSVVWLSKVLRSHRDLRLCLVVEVEDPGTLARWRETLNRNRVQLFPVSGDVLHAQHGVSFYPVLLRSDDGR